MEHADNPLVVPVEYRWHTPEKPFCWDESCPCHEEPGTHCPGCTVGE